ncbi:MAG: hypothetical protein M1825_000953 [Sarcosagium campestre]|nr:MAG: hypothetical protein M1825_000953 [Sarcosagium campestre]
MALPSLVFGAGVIGENFKTPESVANLLEELEKAGIKHVDTARAYPPTDPGQSEILLGKVEAVKKGFTVDTKIQVGSLSKSAIDSSVSASLADLQVDKVTVLYCHYPDPDTPLEEQAKALNDHYVKGRFEKLGISNFSAETLEELIDLCKAKGYVLPSVYQGKYNAIGREGEASLFPLLRKHNIAFVAYSPLAGGFLTGKVTNGTYQEDSRFKRGHFVGEFQRSLYDRPAVHDAIIKLIDTLKPLGFTPEQATLRWLLHHSQLKAGDSIILGASRLTQLESNIKDIRGGPLPEEVIKVVEQMWDEVKGSVG